MNSKRQLKKASITTPKIVRPPFESGCSTILHVQKKSAQCLLSADSIHQSFRDRRWQIVGFGRRRCFFSRKAKFRPPHPLQHGLLYAVCFGLNCCFSCVKRHFSSQTCRDKRFSLLIPSKMALKLPLRITTSPKPHNLPTPNVGLCL